MIHNADALDIIADLGEFDYLITDPPYPVGGQSSMTTADAQRQVGAMMENMAVSLLKAVIKRVRKRPDFLVWVMCDWRTLGAYRNMLLEIGFKSQSCIVWDKVIQGIGQVWMPRHEMILFASEKGAASRRLRLVGSKAFIGHNIITHQRLPGEGEHPFAKPPSLVPKLMGDLPSGRLLDPFCGTGGLLLGAQAIGHDVVGVEMMEDAANLARTRLAGDLEP